MREEKEYTKVIQATPMHKYDTMEKCWFPIVSNSTTQSGLDQWLSSNLGHEQLLSSVLLLPYCRAKDIDSLRKMKPAAASTMPPPDAGNEPVGFERIDKLLALTQCR